MRGTADNNRSTAVWTKSIDDESSSASLSSTRKQSEISLITTMPDSINGELNHDSVSLGTSKVYQTCEQRPSSCRSNEPRRSKSRVRTYLKRCKDAIIGAQTQNGLQQDQSTSNASLDEIRPTAKSSTSSWYVNELFLSRNEVNESATTLALNCDSTGRDEIECVVNAEETPAIVEEISISSAVEIDENNLEFAVSVYERCLFWDSIEHYYAKSCLKERFLDVGVNTMNSWTYRKNQRHLNAKTKIFQLNHDPNSSIIE